MSLEPGRRLGVFELLSRLGVGGMGEVYRARDTRLGRAVALKVLRDEFASNPDRRARFEREARMLASFQHAGIAAIHGYEEWDGFSFLILELVDGKTLSQRLDRGALPVPEALQVARQIALALEAAHGKGIIHRDLKPSNVMLLPDGRVKLLDFGLAKALEGEGPAGPELETASDAGSRAGLVLGTGPYMSPEQARGEAVDKRTDVWAFGCVLFEMLAGRRAFPGKSMAEAVAAVLGREPDWEALPADTPMVVRSLLRRCLSRPPARRLHDIADARIEIEEGLEGPQPVPARRPGRARIAAMILGALATLSLAIWLALPFPGRDGAASRPAHLVFRPQASAPLVSNAYVPFAISPDATDLLYGSHNEQLWIRGLADSEARRLAGGVGYDAFFSPDGRWIAYWARRGIEKIPVTGESSATALCPAEDLLGGAWARSGEIVFAASDHGPLLICPPEGGIPRPYTSLAAGEIGHMWPEFLPGGDALLFTARTGPRADDFQIVVQALATRRRAVVIPGGARARYSPSGHLVYARGHSLYAVRFDVGRLRTLGSADRVADGIARGSVGNAQFAIGADGTLFYVRAAPVPARTLAWVSRSGAAEPLAAPPRHYFEPRLSPDEKRIALLIGDWPENRLWILDIAVDSLRRLTDEPTTPGIWSPDGERLAFGQTADGNLGLASVDLFWQSVDGDEPPELLRDEEAGLWPLSWSPDGRSLLFYRYRADTGDPAGRLALADRAVEPLATGPVGGTATPLVGASLSPDRRWLAYLSDESGAYQLYVQPFARPGARRQLTTEGAAQPLWAAAGREIFYRQGDGMMVIPVDTAAPFHAGKPRLLFRGDYVQGDDSLPDYDVARDGRRFLMIRPGPDEREGKAIEVVQGWSDRLQARWAGDQASAR